MSSTEQPPDPLTRALELVSKLQALVSPMSLQRDNGIADELRAAIRAIGASEWRGLETAKVSEDPLRLLCENQDWPEKPRCVVNAELRKDGAWWDCDEMEPLGSHLKPLAWKPADSVELPAGFGDPAAPLGDGRSYADGSPKCPGEHCPICDGSGPARYPRRIEGGCIPKGVLAILSPSLGPIPEAPHV